MNETPAERARRLGVPLIQNDPMAKAAPTEGVLAVCGQCGSELRKSTAGMCTRMDCPAKMSK